MSRISSSVYRYENTLIFIRMLQLREKGYSKKEEIVDFLTIVGYDQGAIYDAMRILLKNALIESIKLVEVPHISSISISEKGKIYLNQFIYEYTYLLYFCDAVPMTDKFRVNLIDKFGTHDTREGMRGVLAEKNKSVLSFIDFIESEERAELSGCPANHIKSLKSIRWFGTASAIRTAIENTISSMTNENSANVRPRISIRLRAKKSSGITENQ